MKSFNASRLNQVSSGGTLMGFVLGLLLGLAIAVGVAFTLTKGVQVEERPNLNKPLQSKVPLPTEAAKKDPIGSIATQTQGPEYWIQTGAFRNQDEAQKQKATLAMQGLEAMVSEREVDGSLLWRVRVGPFRSQDEVVQNRARLQSAGISSTVIRINKTN